jgi:transcriptional regulator with XRE-family HTH domain
MSDETSVISDDAGRAGRTLGSHFAERVRLLRHQRGWSLERFSTLCGVSRSMLSQIERGDTNPTVAVALAIATALGVSLDTLVMAPGDRAELEVIRADDPHYVYRSDQTCRIRTLSPLTAERAIEFYEVTLQRDGELRSAPHFAGTREHLSVQRGRVRVESGALSAELRTGDSVAYAADVPHAIVNLGRTPAVVYVIDLVS